MSFSLPDATSQWSPGKITPVSRSISFAIVQLLFKISQNALQCGFSGLEQKGLQLVQSV